MAGPVGLVGVGQRGSMTVVGVWWGIYERQLAVATWRHRRSRGGCLRALHVPSFNGTLPRDPGCQHPFRPPLRLCSAEHNMNGSGATADPPPDPRTCLPFSPSAGRGRFLETTNSSLCLRCLSCLWFLHLKEDS